MTDDSGTYNKFRTKIPALGDNANIQDALQIFLYGSTGNASAADDSLVAASSTDTSAGLVGHLQALETTAEQAAPVGSVTQFAGTVLPSGWLWCNGAETNRTEYADLFDVIGVTYGNGNGSTTFNVPNVMGRVPIGAGAGAGLTSRTLAATGGAETHQLSEAEMPYHAHSAWTGNVSADHAHYGNFGNVYWGGVQLSGGGYAPGWMINGTGATGGITANHTHGVGIGGTGGSGYHNNVQPFLVLNYIIKT